MSGSNLMSLAVDPGSKSGSASLIEGRKLIRCMYFAHTPDWETELYRWCILLAPAVVAKEGVHGWSGQGISSTEAFVRNDAKCDAIFKVAGVECVSYQPTQWMQRLGLDPRREIPDASRRRNARRKDQEALALSWFDYSIVCPAALVSGKAKADVFASGLIAYAAALDKAGVPLGKLA